MLRCYVIVDEHVEYIFICSTCLSSIAEHPSIDIEKIIELIKILSVNVDHGCKENVYYGWRDVHNEEFSTYTLCTCPFTGCSFSYALKSMLKSISMNHKGSTHVTLSYFVVSQFVYRRLICISMLPIQ